MRCPVAWVSIFIVSAAVVPLVGGDRLPQGCSPLSSDEFSLLQAAANAKSSASKDAAPKVETASAQHHLPLCFEPETHPDFSMIRDPEPLSEPVVLNSKAPELLASTKVAPAPGIVLGVRGGLWLLSFFFFAVGAARWLPCEAEASLAAAPRVRRTADLPSASQVPQRSELLEAAFAGDDARCESLLDMEGLFLGAGPPEELTAADAWGTTALHAAATGGSHVVAELFLEFGVHVDPVDAHGETPLHLAARGGHVEVCELLVKRGASMRAANAEELTPLAVAGYAEQERVCRSLLAAGAGVADLSEEEMPEMLCELRADAVARRK